MSVVDGYAAAFFEIAKAEGALGTVGSELLTFVNAVDGSPELARTLTDQAVPLDRRLGVVSDLLGDRAHPVTANLLGTVVGSGRARQLKEIVQGLLSRSASEAGKAAGEVRTATPLNEDQRARLTAAIEKATGKKVDLKFLVDPTVLGGVLTRIEDLVIDGTVRSRLDQLKEAI